MIRRQIKDLDKRIVLEYKIKVSDGAGGWTETWVQAGNPIWAAIWPTSANQQIQAMGQVMTISHRTRIRYRSDIRAKWRIKYGAKNYDIVSIVNVEMANEYLDILCKEASA
jgi:SPP1 family predicted phage head-tail adaptor